MGGKGQQQGGGCGFGGLCCLQVLEFCLGCGIWGLIGFGVVVVWVFILFYIVNFEECLVELLFGCFFVIGEEGLNFVLWFFVKVEVVLVLGECIIEIGIGCVGLMDSGLMLMCDQNIVDMVYQVVWNILDFEKFLFNLVDFEDIICVVVEFVMCDIVVCLELVLILNCDCGMIGEDLKVQVQVMLDVYDSGINVVCVNFDRVDLL